MALRSPQVALRRGAPLDPLSIPVYRLLLLVWAALAILAPLRGVSISSDFLVLALPAALSIWLAWCLRARGFAGLATAIECWVLLALICLSFVFLSYVLATLGRPYADGALGQADRLFFPATDWRRDVVAFSKHPAPLRLANRAYESPWWQATVLIVALAAFGRHERCWRFLLAWTIALILTACVFAFAPAAGAYHHYGIPHDAVPGVLNQVGWRQPVLLDKLRTLATIRIGPGDLVGIIEFPSFHAAAGTILCWAYWPLKPLRPAALLLNGAMILAAIPIGGHYLVDILAGMLVGGTCVRAASVIAASTGSVSLAKERTRGFAT